MSFPGTSHRSYRKALKVLFLIFTFVFTSSATAQNEDFYVISGPEGGRARWLKFTDSRNSLYNYLSSQSFHSLNERLGDIEILKTKEQWQKRQARVRETLMQVVGPFPEKTALNAKTVETLTKDGYRIEKVIFESLPKYYVTACLYIPDGLKKKTPAVIYCSGHSDLAFRSPTYQNVILNLVKKGFIVLGFDPVGQGERQHYFDPETGESRIGGATKEHSYPGAQCFLNGQSVARYFIWDGIRVVDYLLTRPEVDPDRIGITGRSGGGTQSSYIAAFDPRIRAAAPECYITSFKRLFESMGPQDAEQNFYHGIANKIDHADLLEIRAPKPTMMITTTRDMFSIQGARETAAEVKNVFKAFNKEENFSMVEDDAPHASTLNNRQALYAFFQKHLDLPGNPQEEEVNILPLDELKITQTGQVSTSIKGETLYSLNRSEAENLLTKLNKSRQNLQAHLPRVQASAKELSGYSRSQKTGSAVFTGRYQRTDYCIEKYYIPGEGDYKIPFILMVPNQGEKHPILLYLHPSGKSAEAAPGGEMEYFVKKGYAVLAADLVGRGEMGPGQFRGDAYEFKVGKGGFNVWFAAIQNATSIVGIQASDVVRLLDYLKQHEKCDTSNISAVARGEMCPVLLHAAAFEKSINQIALISPLISYRSIVMNMYYKPAFIQSTVAGSLTAYDLPDLAACLAPRKLLMVNITDQNGKPADKTDLDLDLSIVRQAYSAKNASPQLQIGDWPSFQNIDHVFNTWLE